MLIGIWVFFLTQQYALFSWMFYFKIHAKKIVSQRHCNHQSLWVVLCFVWMQEVVLGIYPRAFQMLCQCSATELYSQPFPYICQYHQTAKTISLRLVYTETVKCQCSRHVISNLTTTMIFTWQRNGLYQIDKFNKCKLNLYY